MLTEIVLSNIKRRGQSPCVGSLTHGDRCRRKIAQSSKSGEKSVTCHRISRIFWHLTYFILTNYYQGQGSVPSVSWHIICIVTVNQHKGEEYHEIL